MQTGADERRPGPPTPARDDDGPGEGRQADAGEGDGQPTGPAGDPSEDGWPQLSELDLQVCLSDGDRSRMPADDA